MSQLDTKIEVAQLRRVLQKFNEDLGVYINDDQRYKLGRVLTIIDASIGDAEQRKAIKDLVNNEWWTRSSMSERVPMVSPHTDLRSLSIALGFELYEPVSGQLPEANEGDYAEFAVKRYKKIAIEE